MIDPDKPGGAHTAHTLNPRAGGRFVGGPEKRLALRTGRGRDLAPTVLAVDGKF